MEARMQAAVYHGKGDIRFEEVPVPEAGPGELLLKVGTVGVCGSDVGEWYAGAKQHPLTVRHPATGHLGPIIPGHEFSGVVVEVGEGVDESWVGDRVASCGSVTCGECGPCRRGVSNQCVRYHGVGLHRHGALAGYVTAPVGACVSIEGTNLSLDEAALCQPMAIAVHNVSRAGEVRDQTVLVLGAGGIGAFLIHALVAQGATVIAADLDPQRLGVADELGAALTVTLRGDGDRDLDVLRDAVEDRELRVVFEVSGSEPGFATAYAVAPRGCRIVVVGVQKHPRTLDLARLTFDEITLVGTNALIRETDFPRAVALVAERAGKWKSVAPRVIPLRELVDSALRPMSQGKAPAIKTLIDPWGDAARPLT